MLATSRRRQGAAAEAALDVVREHPDTLVRDQYVIEIADRTRIELARLRVLAAERQEVRQRMSTRYRESRHAEPGPNWDEYDPGVDPDDPPRLTRTASPRRTRRSG